MAERISIAEHTAGHRIEGLQPGWFPPVSGERESIPLPEP